MKKLVLVLLTLALIGCSKTNKTEEDVLKVAMECDYAPFNWSQVEKNDYAVEIDSVNFADGYDVQIAKIIASKLNKKLIIVKTVWDSLIPSLTNNSVDLVIAGMTDTEERRKAVSFTSPYYESQMVIIVRKDSDLININSIQELSGKKVLGQINTLYDEVIDQIENVIHVTPLQTYPRMILSLQSQEVDALVAELPVALSAIENNEDLTIVEFDEDKGFKADTTVSIALNLNNEELLKQVEEALSSIDEQTRQEIMLEAIKRKPGLE